MNTHLSRLMFERFMSDVPSVDVSNDELQKLADDHTRIVIVGFWNRVGVQLFVSKIEFTMYLPTVPELEKQFTLVSHLWENHVWLVSFCPLRDKKKLERIARTCDLRLVNAPLQAFPLVDGLPIERAMGIAASRRRVHPQAVYVPIRSPHLHVLEYTTGHRLTADQERAQVAMWHRHK